MFCLERILDEIGPRQSSCRDQFYGSLVLDNDPSTFSHTLTTTDPWLRLYSEYAIRVRTVAVTNRDHRPERLDGFKIKVGNTDPAKKDVNALCYGAVSSVPAGKTVAFPCNPPRTGTYVVVYLYGNNRILSIAELALYGDRAFGEGMIYLRNFVSKVFSAPLRETPGTSLIYFNFHLVFSDCAGTKVRNMYHRFTT